MDPALTEEIEDPNLYQLLHIQDSLKLLTSEILARTSITKDCRAMNEQLRDVNSQVAESQRSHKI